MTFRSKVETKLHAVEDDKIIIERTVASHLCDNIKSVRISLPKVQMQLLAIEESVR